MTRVRRRYRLGGMGARIRSQAPEWQLTKPVRMRWALLAGGKRVRKSAALRYWAALGRVVVEALEEDLSGRLDKTLPSAMRRVKGATPGWPPAGPREKVRSFWSSARRAAVAVGEWITALIAAR